MEVLGEPVVEAAYGAIASHMAALVASSELRVPASSSLPWDWDRARGEAGELGPR